MDIAWAAESHSCMTHSNNEDYYLARPDLGLWVLCDGMGGHRSGQRASWVCAMTIADQVAHGSGLIEAVYEAHWAVWRMAANRSRGKGRCGTTATVLLIRGKRWQIAWVGDSRIWVCDRKSIRQITSDHTVARQLMKWGEITEQEAQVHPGKHRLTQAIGIGEETPEVGFDSGKWDGRQVFLMATDGMAHWDEPRKLFEILSNSKKPDQAVFALVEASLKHGAKDDISVVVVGKTHAVLPIRKGLKKLVPFLDPAM